jgi:hypothetical protein
MKNMRNSLVAGSCHVFGLALLVLSATAGGSAVRAADPSTLQNVVFDPIAQIVLRVEQRIAGLEATVAAYAGSFTSSESSRSGFAWLMAVGRKPALPRRSSML